MKSRGRSFCFLFAVALSFIAATMADAQFVQQGDKLVGTGAAGAAVQGGSVSLSADGNTAIVGGPNDNSYAGAAWVFTRANGVWSQQGDKLVGTGAIGAAHQGSSVSLSADGNTAIIGGPFDDSGTGTGAAWVFTRDTNGIWHQQGDKLIGSGIEGAYGAQQGWSVCLSADGNMAIVGGPTDNNGAGAAWVFTRDTNGIWRQQGSKFVGMDAAGAAQQGYSVSLSADGNMAIVGGPGDDNGAGAVWVVFTRAKNADGWSQEGGKLVGTGAVRAARQGVSVSLSADGNTAIVGGGADNSYAGAAWVFTCDKNGIWSQQGDKLVGTGAIGAAEQGSSVSLSADGNMAIVGGYGDNNGAGAAWVYTRANDVWSQQGSKLVGTGAVGVAGQGSSVSLSADGNTAIVGGALDNNFAGATWVFVLPGSTPAGSNVTVQPVDPNTGTSPVTVTFTSVTTSGTTSVTTSGTGTPPPNGFKLGNPPVYYTIDTTAGYSGPIQICINYSGISYGNEKNLRLFHWSSTTNSWQDVTDPGYPDTVNKIICGTITSFSLFGVFEPSYSFTGFLPPVENPPVMNTAKAGQTIPVKWQLVDSGGGYISDLSVVTGITFQQVQCSDISAALTNEVSTTTSGSSGLRYDTSTNQFIYTWKTDKSMAGNCYLLTLTLYEFNKYEAYFELK